MDRMQQESNEPESQEPESQTSEAQTPEAQTSEVQEPAHESDVRTHEAQNPESQDHTCHLQDPAPQRHEETGCIAHGREETGMEVAMEEHRYVWLCYAKPERYIEKGIPVLLQLRVQGQN